MSKKLTRAVAGAASLAAISFASMPMAGLASAQSLEGSVENATSVGNGVDSEPVEAGTAKLVQQNESEFELRAGDNVTIKPSEDGNPAELKRGDEVVDLPSEAKDKNGNNVKLKYVGDEDSVRIQVIDPEKTSIGSAGSVISGGEQQYGGWKCALGTGGGGGGGGLAGAAAGATIGAAGGPIGAGAGAIIGGVSGAATGAAASCF